MADAIRDALHMDQSERIERWRAMMDTISTYDVRWWSSTYLAELARHSRAEAPAATP